MARPGENINHVKVAEIAGTQQQRFAYNTDLMVEYAGYAAKGADAADTTAWTIYKFTYNTTKQCTLRQTCFTSWDGRETGTYD